MFSIRLFILFCFSLSVYANENYIDSLTLNKIKKLVEKEEEIAVAYKKYLLEKGINPTTIEILKTNGYLPEGFDVNNPFGKQITFIEDNNSTATNKKDDKHKIKGFETTDSALKSNLYDYYYSNKYRVYTKAPLSVNNSNVEIILTLKEKFIYENQSNITTVKSEAISATTGKYYLDTNGVLHWYQSGSYKFSVDKDLIVDENITILNSDGSVNTAYKNMVQDVVYSGQIILQNNSSTNNAESYLGINESKIIKQNPSITQDSIPALIQISKNSGGMIVNGDIYTWGNNLNKTTGISISNYTKGTGIAGSSTPVITTLVKLKAKIYDNDSSDSVDLTNFYGQNYFSSPLRPKFVDLFTNTKNGTCAITTNGELFCGGTTASNFTFGNNFTQVDSVKDGEMLYRTTYFDGTTASTKASKIFANNQLWLILSKEGDIYRWGYESSPNLNGFSGNGNSTFSTSTATTKLPEKINLSTVKFNDITNSLSTGYRKMAALSTTGEIYIWGKDTNIADMTTTSCSAAWEGVSFSLCTPTRITTSNSTLIADLTFNSIQSGLKAIIGLGSNGKYYKIDQPLNKKIQVTEIKDGTTVLPTDVLSVDITSDGTVVYVTSDNKLVSTYFSTSSSFDDIFRTTINSMLWKKIKVLEDTNNSMCGITTDDQMYCWGVQTYLDSSNTENNTFMLPVFNTNLFDSKKDYMVVEGATNSLTSMTSGNTWLSNSKFYIKYPTYIGGFNYEFIFK